METSWQLLQRSLQVMRKNPRLLLFPVVSTAFTVVLAVFFLAPIIAYAISAGWLRNDWHAVGDRFNHLFYFYGIGIYIVSMFVATFFNVAFYNEIIRALAGEPVSLGSGLRFALSKVRPILMWSLLAATVGLIIRFIEDRMGWIGKLVMGLVGMAWSVAAVFAIPVIIRREDSNPIAVLRDSAVTLKRTWGESLIGYLGIRLGGVVFVAVSVVVGAMLLLTTAVLHSPVVMVLLGVVWLAAMLIAAFLITMANHVYKCALYVYASEGVVPGPFTADLLNAAWKVKKA